VVAAAGNLDHERLVDLATQAFSGMEAGSGSRTVKPPEHRAEVVMREKTELEQLHLCLGVPALHHEHPKRYCGYVMNTVLGGSMSSRLFQRVREERGLAYTVYSSMNSFADTGFLAVYAATRPDGAVELVESINEELAALKSKGIDANELQGAKDHLKGNLMLSLESSSSRMGNLARQHICYEKQCELDEIIAGIDAVTADGVQALAREILDGRRCTAAVIGRLDGLNLSTGDFSF
jgi:predicted Zn-dependent peptidase